MTYALCADLHMHAWSMFAKTNPDGVNSRLQHILDEFKRMCEHARKARIKRVYIAGDLFHVRGKIQPSVFNPVQRALEFAALSGLEIAILAGNHDLESNESEWLGSAISALENEHDNGAIRVYNEPHFFQEDQVALVPWISKREKLREAIEKLKDDIRATNEDPAEYDLLLHTGINGVISGMPDHGWDASELADLGFYRVFAGHYHNHKHFTPLRPGSLTDVTDVVSIGALTHQTWSDVGNKAGWMTVGDKEFWFHEAATPRFLDYDAVDDVSEYAGNYVRVRGVPLEESEIREIRQQIEDCGALGVVVHVAPKNKIVTRNGKSSQQGVSMEKSIAGWIKDAELEHAEEIERLAIDTLQHAQAIS